MARSYNIWRIVLEDDTKLYTIANSVSQILYSDIISDWDAITKIEQLEIYCDYLKDDYPDIIDLRKD